MPEKKINLVFDIDGMLSADMYIDSEESYATQFSREKMPLSWGNYLENHVIMVRYGKKIYHHLLLPGVLEMLHIFFLNLKEKVKVYFFSAGPEERNLLYCKILTEKIAIRAGVKPGDLEYQVYSLHHCEPVASNSELQPTPQNNLFIVDDSKAYAFKDSKVKKILSNFFPDLSNVILIDDSCSVVINSETSNLLKVFTCIDFSSDLFRHCSMRETEKDKQILSNFQFLIDESFYAVNHALYALELILTVIKLSKEKDISPVRALEMLQVCSIKKKYKYSIFDYPDHIRYGIQYYFNGYKTIKKINPNFELFLPYPHLFLDTIEIYNDYFLLNTTLHHAMGYKNHQEHIVKLIQEYHGTSATPPAPPAFSLLSKGISFFGGLAGLALAGPIYAGAGIIGGMIAAKTSEKLAKDCCKRKIRM